MIRILASAGSFPSARILRDAIRSLGEEKVGLYGRPELLRTSPDIRYGNSDGRWSTKRDTEMNSVGFIHLCANKANTSNTLARLAPKTFDFPIFHQCSEVPDKYPVLVRKTLTGSGGIGIVIVRNKEEFLPYRRSNYVWTEFMNLSREYRIHMLGENISRIFEKLPIDSNNKEEIPIRNLHRGYHYSLVAGVEGFTELKLACKELFSFFGNRFYGLDIGWNRDSKKYFVIELNSAPGLNEHTAVDYAHFICRGL
jgi:hypothetical protein